MAVKMSFSVCSARLVIPILVEIERDTMLIFVGLDYEGAKLSNIGFRGKRYSN
jgi:hypothetical protein